MKCLALACNRKYIGAQNQNYRVQPKRTYPQVCLTFGHLQPFPCRWRGVENPLLS